MTTLLLQLTNGHWNAGVPARNCALTHASHPGVLQVDRFPSRSGEPRLAPSLSEQSLC